MKALGDRWWWVVSITCRPFYFRARPFTHSIGCWVGPRAGLYGWRKLHPHRDFCFVLSLYCILTWFFVLLALHSVFYLYCTTHCVLCILLLLIPLQHTNIHAPGGIRTRNPSKWSAADPRLRLLGGFCPQTVQPVESRCAECAVPAHTFTYNAVNSERQYLVQSCPSYLGTKF